MSENIKNFVESSSSSLSENTKELDIYRDTPLRYCGKAFVVIFLVLSFWDFYHLFIGIVPTTTGYANEVGESFRPLVKKIFVNFSYAIAIAYVLTDAGDKSYKTYHVREWIQKLFNYNNLSIQFASHMHTETQSAWWRIHKSRPTSGRCIHMANVGLGCYTRFHNQSNHLGFGKTIETGQGSWSATQMESDINRFGFNTIHNKTNRSCCWRWYGQNVS